MSPGSSPSDRFVRVVLVLLLAAVVAGGCSAIAARPYRTSDHQLHCASYVPPVFDTAVALTGIGMLAWSATDHDSGEGDQHTLTTREFIGAPGALVALVFGVSAIYGYNELTSCRREEAKAARRK